MTDFKESSVKKLKEIKVEASHKAQGIEVFFARARRVAKVDWGSIVVCAFCKKVSFRKPGITSGRSRVGKRERDRGVFPTTYCSVSPATSKVSSPLRGRRD